MFIQTEATPNPATLKFLPGRVVIPEGTFDARDAKGAARSPLAQALFQVPGVAGVFLGHDFVTVTKGQGSGPGGGEDHEWQHMRPAILGAIMQHFMSGAPVLLEDAAADAAEEGEEFFDPEDVGTVETIKDLLETRVRPAVAGDGGDITFRGFKDGVVYLAMKGSCAGCPSSTATLKHGIQNLLRHFLPDVQEVRAV